MPRTPLQHLAALLAYARPHWRLVALQFALMALAIGFGLLKPWPLKVLVDHVIGDTPFDLGGWTLDWGWQALLAGACLAYLLFHAGESLVQVGSTATATLSSSRMIRDLRGDLLDKLQALSVRFHDSHKVGDLVHRVAHNSPAVETAFQSGFMGVSKSVVMLAAMFAVMVAMSPLLTLVAMAVVPLLLLAIRFYAKRINAVSFAHQTQEGAVSSLLQEVLSAIRLVKACNREDLEGRRFRDACGQSIATRLRSTMVQSAFGFCTAVVLAAGTAALFWAGAHQVRAGALTTGEFLVFLAYLAMLYGPLSVLSYTSSSVQSALGGARRLFEILDSDDEVPDPADPQAVDGFRRELRFEGVHFAYEPGVPVLRGIDLAVRRGETVAIVGETGGGKSTLLSLALRFHDPVDGSILLDGVDIRRIAQREVRELIAFVPQDVLLLSDTIRGNIAFGRPEASEEEIAEAARRAQAMEFIERSPQGMETLIGERGVRLSTGQRQRIAIARALVRRAPILLVDEPTSALDAETEARVLEGLAADPELTVVVVAHRLSTVRGAHRIIVLAGGRIAEQGTHDELMALGGSYHALWEAQASPFRQAAEEAVP